MNSGTEMPHARDRYARAIIEKGISLSPLVGVVGHRQVGKTTLLEQLAKTYVTFDDRAALKLAGPDLHSISRKCSGVDPHPSGRA